MTVQRARLARTPRSPHGDVRQKYEVMYFYIHLMAYNRSCWRHSSQSSPFSTGSERFYLTYYPKFGHRRTPSRHTIPMLESVAYLRFGSAKMSSWMDNSSQTEVLNTYLRQRWLSIPDLTVWNLLSKSEQIRFIQQRTGYKKENIVISDTQIQRCPCVLIPSPFLCFFFWAYSCGFGWASERHAALD